MCLEICSLLWKDTHFAVEIAQEETTKENAIKSL